MEQEVITDISKKIRDFQAIIANNIDFKKYTKQLDKMILELERPLILMVMGEFSTGKSTFINALLGSELLQMNATPTTAVITKLCYGEKDEIIVHYRNGKQEGKTPQEFLSLTAESNGQTNEIHKEIDYVERKLPAAFLKDVTIIDSPGLNAIKEAHGAATRRFMDNADVVIWMLSAEKAGSLTEIKAMEELPPEIKPIALVNKMDLVDEEEDSPEELLDNIRGLLGDHVQQVIGISAEYALQGKLQNNAPMLEASAISDFYKVYEDVVTANAVAYKMNGILRDISEFIYDIGKDFEELDQVDSEEIKAKTVPVIDCFKVLLLNAIWEYSQSIPENTATQVFRGVLYLFGFIVNKNVDNMILLLEKAANKNDRAALTLLGQYYYDNGEPKKALNYWQRGAELECADCQALLADLYFEDKFVDSDLSYKYAKLACEQNNPLGYFILGSCLLTGWGVNQDINHAIKCLEKYEEMTSTGDGYYMIGEYYHTELEPANIPKAIEYYQKAIESGNKDALEAISHCYDTIKNYKLAFSYLKQSADYNKASAEALYVLGGYYNGGVNGYVPNQSPKTAFKFLKRAAEMDYAEAQYILALCYFNGDGVSKNVQNGIFWLLKSAENGCSNAQIVLAVYYITGTNIAENKEEGFKWLTKAVEHDKSGWAYYWLGHFNEVGDGIPVNHQKAFYCYQKSADLGYIDGIYYLGRCYWYGCGTPQNYNMSFKCFNKAANAGLADAQYYLGLCHELKRGTGQEFDLSVTKAWYQKAANQGYEEALVALHVLTIREKADNGDKDAQFTLATFYDNSNRDRYDQALSREYLLKAAANGHPEAQYYVGLDYYNNKDSRAYQWLENASNQGYIEAQSLLGACLAVGNGIIPQDLAKGKKLLQKAANKGHEDAKRILDQINKNPKYKSDDDSGCGLMGCAILVAFIIVVLKILAH